MNLSMSWQYALTLDKPLNKKVAKPVSAPKPTEVKPEVKKSVKKQCKCGGNCKHESPEKMTIAMAKELAEAVEKSGDDFGS